MVGLATIAVLGAALTGVRAQTKYEPKFRISPIDGSKIALPTKDQLAFQDREIGALIHFNIATYLDEKLDGCNNVPELVPSPDLFDPELLNTDQWMDTIKSFGAKYATLVAKHNCGFATWPSKVQFPTKDGTESDYNYTTVDSPLHGKDVVGSFIKSAEKYNVGRGFYYSVVVNNFLNVQNSKVRTNPLAPGQVGITDDTYNQIVFDQLTELWTNYGKLTEIWFDGGYSATQIDKIQALLSSHQPQAAIFNGCQEDGTCVSPNSVRWIGNELGDAPEDTWSTGLINGGDPTSPYFCPAECDTTLQANDRWFYGANSTLRSLDEMIGVYHTTVGRNCLLELDLAPDRDGLIPPNHVALYKQLGDFVKSCYGKPVAGVKGKAEPKGGYRLKFNRPTSIDRIQLMEDQSNGQVIRSYQVNAKVVDKNGWKGKWTVVSQGKSVGHKKIDLFKSPVEVTEVFINTTYVDEPKWRSVSVHLCS